MIGQDPEVSDIAQQFIWASLPHLLFTATFDVQKHQLNCFRLSYLQMIAQATGTLLHIPILMAMMEAFSDSPITGIGVATTLSSFIKLIMVLILGFCESDVRKSYISPLSNFFASPTQEVPSSFMTIGFPSLVMFCAENWALQSLVLIAGFISVEDQAVQGMCAIICSTLFMFGAGFAEASSTIIGNMIGANRVGFAWHYKDVMYALSIFFTLIAQVPLFAYLE